jgi:peptidoglycan/LPS O-acetylase OafA/YrhL
LLAGGYRGVAFFFVLSGFLLTWGTDPRRSAIRFYVRRFARTYHCHAVVWLLVLVLVLVSGPTDPFHALLNLLLLHAWSVRLDDVFSVTA